MSFLTKIWYRIFKIKEDNYLDSLIASYPNTVKEYFDRKADERLDTIHKKRQVELINFKNNIKNDKSR